MSRVSFLSLVMFVIAVIMIGVPFMKNNQPNDGEKTDTSSQEERTEPVAPQSAPEADEEGQSQGLEYSLLMDDAYGYYYTILKRQTEYYENLEVRLWENGRITFYDKLGLFSALAYECKPGKNKFIGSGDFDCQIDLFRPAKGWFDGDDFHIHVHHYDIAHDRVSERPSYALLITDVAQHPQ